MQLAAVAIAAAIQNGYTLTFIYKQKLRVVEPYALGANGKLRAYQLIPEEGWRLFETELIHPPVASEVIRPGYNPNGDKAMPEGIIVSRKYEPAAA